jgi:hypothetical protein
MLAATGTQWGVVSITTQTFAGEKIFTSGGVIVNTASAPSSTGQVAIGGKQVLINDGSSSTWSIFSDSRLEMRSTTSTNYPSSDNRSHGVSEDGLRARYYNSGSLVETYTAGFEYDTGASGLFFNIATTSDPTYMGAGGFSVGRQRGVGGTMDGMVVNGGIVTTFDTTNYMLLPKPPGTGTKTLQSVDGVLSWV